MQYITLSADNKITAVADWQFPDSIPAQEEVVRNEEGAFVFRSQIDEAHEQAVRDKREADRIAAEEAKAAEEARVPDLEDAVMELAEVVTTETEDNSNAIVDLAAYVAEMEARIAALEAAKEMV